MTKFKNVLGAHMSETNKGDFHVSFYKNSVEKGTENGY